MAEGINKALVVDDSRLARIALSKLLQKRSVEVDVVGTGTEALDYLGSTRPDVVFMDYMMPDMDGFEATRRIRALPAGGADLPVVMYTSQDTDEDREKARQLGIAGFLSKPSGEHNLDEVLSRLGALVRQEAPAAPRRPEPATPAPPPAATTRVSARARPRPAVEPTLFDEPDPSGKAEQREPTLDLDFEINRDRPWIEDEPASPAEPAPAPEVPWPAIRDVARQAADEAVMAAAERAVVAASAELREEMQALADKAGERAREAAEEAAREVSSGLAEQTAQAISEQVAEDMASRLADELGPEASRRIMGDLRRDVRNYVGELFAADAFRDQLVDLVSETALPAISSRVAQEAFPKLREQVLRETIQHAEKYTVQAAREESREAVEEMLDQAMEERLAEFGASVEARARHMAAEAAGRVRTQMTVALIVVILVLGGALGWVLMTGGAL